MLDTLTLLRAMNGIHEEDVVMAGTIYFSNKIMPHIKAKRLITFALAAALLLTLGITAYATGFFGLIDSQMGDAVVEYNGVDPISGIIESREDMAQGLNRVPVRVVSLQGWRDSPEYLANQEWQSFYDDYVMNNYYGDEVPNSSQNAYFSRFQNDYLALSASQKVKFDALIDMCYSCLNGIQAAIEQSQFPDCIVSDGEKILPHSLPRLKSPQLFHSHAERRHIRCAPAL